MLIGLIGVKGAGKDTCAEFLVREKQFRRVAFADALYGETASAYQVTVAFLGNRATKERPLPELALTHCQDLAFVEAAVATLTRSRALRRAVLARAASGTYMKGVSRRQVNAILNAPRSPRWTLQLWGTEYRRRAYGEDEYWLKRVQAEIDSHPECSFVVTDVRFKNEADFIERMAGGLLVRVRRPDLERLEAANRARNGTAAHPSETELLNRTVAFEVLNKESQPESLRDGIFAILQ